MKQASVRITVEITDFDGNPNDILRFGICRSLSRGDQREERVAIKQSRYDCITAMYKRMLKDHEYLVKWNEQENAISGTLDVVIPHGMGLYYKDYLKRKEND